MGLQNTPTASLQSGKTLPLPYECPRYVTKQSDGEVSVMLELWGMRSTPLLPGVVVPDRVPSMGQIELNTVLILN